MDRTMKMAGYSAVPRWRPSGISESELIGSITLREEARPCVCGGVIVADPIDPTAGVRRHQETTQHRSWSSQAYPEQPTADTYPIDLSEMTSRASAAPGSKPDVQ